jgi:hypothetical protein
MVTSTNEASPPLPPLPPPLPPINVNPSSNGKQSKPSPNKKSSNSKSNHSPTSASANTSSDLSIQQQRNHIWHARYDELKHFKTIKGHCNVPQRDTEFGALGGWVASVSLVVVLFVFEPLCSAKRSLKSNITLLPSVILPFFDP